MSQTSETYRSPILTNEIRKEMKGENLDVDWVVILTSPDYEWTSCKFDNELKALEHILAVFDGEEGSWRVYGLYFNGYPCKWGRTHIIVTLQVYPTFEDMVNQ